MRFQHLSLLPILGAVLAVVWFVRAKIRSARPHSLVHRFRHWNLQRARWVRLPEFLMTAALLAVTLSLLDPVLSLSQIGVTTRGLNIVMLVDLSSSMLEYMHQSAETAGIQMRGTTKLDAAKEAISRFIERRQTDRVGTIVFSEQAYVVTPLTLDYGYVRSYMNFVDYQTLAGEGRTAIGEAVVAGLSLIRWKEPKRNAPAVVVIFTDGESNAGRSIYDALALARKENVHVYLIGLDIWYLQERERLTEAIRATGGVFLDVKDLDQLKMAYEEIDALERQPMVTQQYVRNLPYYYPFAAVALLCLALGAVLRAIPYFAELS